MSLFLTEKCHTCTPLSPVKYTINSIKIHNGNFISIPSHFCQGRRKHRVLLQAICSCNRSAFTTARQVAVNDQHATTEHLLPCKPFSRLPDLLSYSSTSLFPPSKQKYCFHSAASFPPFTNADTCNKFLFKEADHSRAVYYE